MNKDQVPLRLQFLLSLLISIFWASCLPAELIEPTRTLDSTEAAGKLSVYSEPPEIEVSVDGQKAGKTPMLSMSLPAGEHTVRVRSTEFNVTVSAGKTTAVSWFRGEIIRIPEEPSSFGRGSAASPQGQEPPQRRTPPPAPQEKLPNEPFYWPLNPTGPIY